MPHLRIVFTGFLALALFACSDAAPAGGMDVPGRDGGPVPIGGMDEQPPIPDDGPRELRIICPNNLPEGSSCNPVSNSETDLYALVGSDSVELTISLLSGAGAVRDARVAFKMYDDRGAEAGRMGVGGSVLVSTNGQTDQRGEATVQLRVGDEETTFEVEATAANAERPVRWLVTVGRQGEGGLRVSLNYDPANGRYTFRQLRKAEVLLFDRENCAQLAQTVTDLFGAYLSVPVEPFDSVDNTANILGLEDRARFTVAAVAYNAEDNTVAFGCADAIEVVGGRSTAVSLDVRDLPLYFKDRFRMLHSFDLTGLLRMSDNESLQTVAQVLDIVRIIGSDGQERQEHLRQLLCDIADLGDTVCNLLGRVGAALIDRVLNEVIATEVPQVYAALRAISDVLTILTDMTIIGEFEFVVETADSMGYIPPQVNPEAANETRFQKFRFVWRNGCPPGADCNQEFPIGELQDDGMVVDRAAPIRGEFTARLVGDELEIHEHTLEIRYALILLGLLEQWVIPAAIGAEPPFTLDEMLASLLPCESIDNTLGLNGFCQDVLVEGLAGALREELGRLSFGNDDFTLEGWCTPVDEDGDLRIDLLQDGFWSGIIGGELEFLGCFNGCRGLDCQPEECIVPAMPPMRGEMAMEGD